MRRSRRAEPNRTGPERARRRFPAGPDPESGRDVQAAKKRVCADAGREMEKIFGHAPWRNGNRCRERPAGEAAPRRPRIDYDSPWKEALDRYFQHCLAFFFPQAYAEIDWARGYEMLDKELQPIVRQAKRGRRYVDKLVKVWLKSGEERWFLIHVEVQTGKEGEFPKRMYVYNHRIFDRYDREVISLAILADDDPDWRPSQFGYSRWGFRTGTEFPFVKLLDYAPRVQELEADPNPFAMVVLAPQDPGDPPVARRSACLEAAVGQGAVRAGDGCGRYPTALSVHRLDHGATGGTGTAVWARTPRLSAGEVYAIYHDYGADG